MKHLRQISRSATPTANIDTTQSAKMNEFTQKTLKKLKNWLNLNKARELKVKDIPIDKTLLTFVDASRWGWGAIIFRNSKPIIIEEHQWEKEWENRDMPELEAQAMSNLLKIHGRLLYRSKILTDSGSLVAATEMGKARNFHINNAVGTIKRLEVEIEHIPSEQNLADSHSRRYQPDSTEQKESTSRSATNDLA